MFALRWHYIKSIPRHNTDKYLRLDLYIKKAAMQEHFCSCMVVVSF